MSAQVCLTLQTLLSHSLGLKLPKIFVLGATKNIYHSSSARDICNTSKTRDMYYLPGLGKKYMYVYEICLRQQKQIVISYLAFSSLGVDSQVVRWQKSLTKFSTRQSFRGNRWLSRSDIRWGQIHMYEIPCMESVCYTLCNTCSVFVCLRLSYNQT